MKGCIFSQVTVSSLGKAINNIASLQRERKTFQKEKLASDDSLKKTFLGASEKAKASPRKAS